MLLLLMHICLGAPSTLTKGLEITLLSVLSINHKEGKLNGWEKKSIQKRVNGKKVLEIQQMQLTPQSSGEQT